MYKEGINSTVTHNGNEYLVDDLLLMCNDLSTVHLDISVLSWILDYTTVHNDRVHNSNLDYPIIVFEDDLCYYVLDGVHRLTKAINCNCTTIKCKIIKELPRGIYGTNYCTIYKYSA